jgi:type VI secretion system secreted protein Hcp
MAHAISGENMAVDIFIKIGDIKGESMDKAHKDEIDVLNWSWGMTQSGNMHVGGGGGAGKVNVHDLSLTKYVDKASPNLMMHCASGKHIDKVKLTVRKAGGESQVEYMIINLEEVLVTSLGTGGSGSDELRQGIGRLPTAEGGRHQGRWPDQIWLEHPSEREGVAESPPVRRSGGIWCLLESIFPLSV